MPAHFGESSSTAPPASWGGDLGRAVVEIACRAPSIHNTQPWSWEITPTELNLRADRRRQLRVADPDGHSLLVSCGAALALTDTALGALGWRVRIDRLPDPSDRDLVARFTPDGPTGPSDRDQDDVRAALERRSDRRAVGAKEVPDDVIERLRAAAALEEVFVHFPTQPDELVNLTVAVSWADRQGREDPAYTEEMQQWVRTGGPADDGVPLDALPRVESDHPRRTDVPVRDFLVGTSGKELIETDVDDKPLIAVLLSRSDTNLDQLRAGESMMRLMLEAQRLGLATCPLSQAVDWLAFRARVQTLMGWLGLPQMMVRIGYPSTQPEPPLTPRRPLESVLTVRDDPAGP